MSRNRSPQDLNDVALANFRELIAADDELAPEWKAQLAALLTDGIPNDLSTVEELVPVERRHDSTQEA